MEMCLNIWTLDLELFWCEFSELGHMVSMVSVTRETKCSFPVYKWQPKHSLAGVWIAFSACNTTLLHHVDMWQQLRIVGAKLHTHHSLVTHSQFSWPSHQTNELSLYSEFKQFQRRPVNSSQCDFDLSGSCTFLGTWSWLEAFKRNFLHDSILHKDNYIVVPCQLYLYLFTGLTS